MKTMRTLKLKGAARYTVLPVKKEPILRNQTIDVDDATAERLLTETVRDRANTEWPVWQDVTGEGKAGVDKEVVKPKRRTRRTKKAATPDQTEAA